MKHNIWYWLRWLLVTPAMVAGYVIGFYSGAFIISITRDQTIAFSIGVSIAATLWVLLPALIAPAHKTKTATIAYVAGLLCAAYLAKDGIDILGLFLVAASSGAITLWLISAYIKSCKKCRVTAS